MGKCKDSPLQSSRPGSYRSWDSEKQDYYWFYEGGQEPAYMVWDLAKKDYVLVIPPKPGQAASQPQALWNETMNRYVVIPNSVASAVDKLTRMHAAFGRV
jgi:hypothetical protein